MFGAAFRTGIAALKAVDADLGRNILILRINASVLELSEMGC